jgi:hypothetical protein
MARERRDKPPRAFHAEAYLLISAELCRRQNGQEMWKKTPSRLAKQHNDGFLSSPSQIADCAASLIMAKGRLPKLSFPYRPDRLLY